MPAVKRKMTDLKDKILAMKNLLNSSMKFWLNGLSDQMENEDSEVKHNQQ